MLLLCRLFSALACAELRAVLCYAALGCAKHAKPCNLLPKHRMLSSFVEWSRRGCEEGCASHCPATAVVAAVGPAVLKRLSAARVPQAQRT